MNTRSLLAACVDSQAHTFPTHRAQPATPVQTLSAPHPQGRTPHRTDCLRTVRPTTLTHPPCVQPQVAPSATGPTRTARPPLRRLQVRQASSRLRQRRPTRCISRRPAEASTVGLRLRSTHTAPHPRRSVSPVPPPSTGEPPKSKVSRVSHYRSPLETVVLPVCSSLLTPPATSPSLYCANQRMCCL